MSAQFPSLEVNIAGGARVCVPAALDQITPYVLLEQEDWFEDEIRFVRRWLKPGMRAIDVGASFGLYALAMARAVGADGRVWCFEPTARTAEFLQRSLEINDCDNVHLESAAVSDRDGSIALAVGPDSELNAVVAEREASPGIVEVESVTLDRRAITGGWDSVDLLKLDVEGHEYEAIQGGAEFLRASSPLLMLEIQAGMTVDLRPLRLLAQMGYGLYRLLPGPLWLVPFDPTELATLQLLNVFACRPDRSASLAASGFLACDDVELPPPAADSWLSLSLAMPYTRGLGGRWPAKAGVFSGGGLASYLQGLAAYAHYRDQARSASERTAWLNHALQCVAESIDAKPTLARCISHARLAAELGMRKAALEAIAEAARRVQDEFAAASGEPFLAPSRRYESVPADGDTRLWLQCAVSEQLEKARAPSSFGGATSLEILAPIRGLPACSPEMERRWQLVRMRHGLQARPEAVAVLRERTEENLNPQFWSGLAQIR